MRSRQREVFLRKARAAGLTVRQIAEILDRSPATVQYHLAKLAVPVPSPKIERAKISPTGKGERL